MGKQYKILTQDDTLFIKEQKLFYIASSSRHEVNLSPKGYDSLYVFDPSTLYMIDYLGSGNRTARDINEDGEVTLLFNAFENAPKILRCFCKGEVILKTDEGFKKASSYFTEDMNAIRHILKLTIYAVESSCGMGVPIMVYKGERSEVRDYALEMSQKGEFDTYVIEHALPPNLHEL